MVLRRRSSVTQSGKIRKKESSGEYCDFLFDGLTPLIHSLPLFRKLRAKRSRAGQFGASSSTGASLMGYGMGMLTGVNSRW
jgi:hypothetical protein